MIIDTSIAQPNRGRKRKNDIDNSHWAAFSKACESFTAESETSEEPKDGGETNNL